MDFIGTGLLACNPTSVTSNLYIIVLTSCWQITHSRPNTSYTTSL